MHRCYDNLWHENSDDIQWHLYIQSDPHYIFILQSLQIQQHLDIQGDPYYIFILQSLQILQRVITYLITPCTGEHWVLWYLKYPFSI